MNKASRIVDVVQSVTGFAVVIGLVLVILELQQTKTLARVQLASDYYSELMATYRAQLGENPAGAIVRACLSPEGLTIEEREVALAALDLSYTEIERNKRLQEIGAFGIPWEQYAESTLKHILGTPIGRYDYETFRDTPRWMREIRPIADGILERHEQIPCQQFWDGFEGWIVANGAREDLGGP